MEIIKYKLPAQRKLEVSLPPVSQIAIQLLLAIASSIVDYKSGLIGGVASERQQW